MTRQVGRTLKTQGSSGFVTPKLEYRPNFPSWFRDFQLLADGSNSAFLYFAMPREGGDFAVPRVFPNRMIFSLAGKKTGMSAQMPFQINSLHEVARLNSSRVAPGMGFFRASSR